MIHITNQSNQPLIVCANFRFTFNEDIEEIGETSPAKHKVIKNPNKMSRSSASSGPRQSGLNLSANIDMINDGVPFIGDDDDFNDISNADPMLLEKTDVEGVLRVERNAAQELENEFLPTITHVTSLHPSEFNDLMNFQPNQMESAEIL